MKFLSYGVMIYMLLALIWWTTLLTRNNRSLYDSKVDWLQVTQNQLYKVEDFNIEETIEYDQLTQAYQRGKNMILGEGLVFGISLILGMWFIQNAYSRELNTNRKQKNFLLSITHELKSPIASINLITQTLLKRKLDTEKTTELHESILSESTRIEKLINNLLFATRINNEYKYNFENIDIVSLIDDIVKKFKFQHADAQILTHFESNQIFIFVDREAFISLITNLIENAIKYSNEKPIIHIELHNNESIATITVKDNGNGIPETEKPKVTQQFYRIGNEETRQTKGTGLGLYIIDKMVKAHQGKLKILDNKPKGTQFIITLPAKQ